MFRHLLSGVDTQTTVISILLSLPIILLSLSLHEAAHGAAALWMGDPTARNMGRLTLDPRKHLNLFGTLCMIVAGFGWANPVPINSRYFRRPRRGIAIVSLAGPVSNLLLAFVFLLLLRFVGFGWLWQMSVPTAFAAKAAYFFVIFLYYGVSMNVTLAVFNLLPIPPLDGSRILFALLPPRYYFKIAPYERYIVLAVMLLLLLGPLSWLLNLLCSLILRGMFALVGMPGFLI